MTPGRWYGWPDFHGSRPLSDGGYYGPPDGPAPGFLLAAHPNAPPRPAAVLGVHSSSVGLDFSRDPAFGYLGQAFIAQFGDLAPEVGKVLGPSLNDKPLPGWLIAFQVRHGLGVMPAFSSEEISDADLGALVAYLREHSGDAASRD